MDLHHLEEIVLKRPEIARLEMGKLREIDRRKQRHYQPGDIVTPSSRLQNEQFITGSIGIVLKEILKGKRSGQPGSHTPPTDQICLVYFGSTHTDLFNAARKYACALVHDPGYHPEGVAVSCRDMDYSESQPSWLDAPSIDEVQLMRFAEIANEI